MNKKFFAALSLAGVLLSQGSVAVWAEEMEEVESGSVPGTDVEQQTTVKLDDVNFPDDNFRDAVLKAYNDAFGTSGTISVGTNVKAGDTVKTEDLAKITYLGSGATAASDDAYKATSSTVTYLGFKDLTGIEYLTGLTILNLQASPNLKVADLSANEELVTVIIAPVAVAPSSSATTPSSISVASSGGGAVPTVTSIVPALSNTSDLYSITLPEETTNLTDLVIEGASQLTTLDLSAYDELNYVDLQNNELAQLNVEGCVSIATLDISGNDLTGLDVSTLKALVTLTATNNNLYELELPSGKSLKTVNVSDNKLVTIDVSGLRNLDDLNVSDNRLEAIDLSEIKSLTKLNVSNNHLAALDVAENTSLQTATTTDLVASPQYLYANATDAGIDLASYDENFQASSGTPAVGWVATTSNEVTGGSITKAGVLEFASNITPSAISTGISYDYNIGAAVTMTVNIVQADLMNRLYNPNSGEHFYTADLNEKDTLVKLGWQAEGIGWVAPQENYPTTPVAAGEAVFRLYNKNAGDHHYTKDSKEKDVLVRAGWDYEGVGWYSAKPHNDDTTSVTVGSDTYTGITSYSLQVYREYNPNAKEAGAHNYTTSENENDTLVALGWLDEGIGWWALK